MFGERAGADTALSPEVAKASLDFARQQAQFSYDMAEQLSAGEDDRSIEDRASDAVRAAIRIEKEAERDVSDVDLEFATQALVEAVSIHARGTQ